MLLLHISDIHFRRGEAGTAMDPNFHLRNELVRDAEARCAELGAPDAILLSGDIAFSGHQEEFDFATQWLQTLCQRCGTSLGAVFVCPGNHDVDRSVSGRSLIQALHRDIKQTESMLLDQRLRDQLTDADTGKLLYESIAVYNRFAVQFFCDLLPPKQTTTVRELFLNDGSKLCLWGLNSTFVSHIDVRGQLCVDPSYLHITRESGVEHIVMCHHPYEWLRQNVTLKDHLGNVSRLQLFGHEHTNRIEVGRDWIRIAASAAHPDRTEPGWEPGYNLIELSVDGTGDQRFLDVGVHVRVWQTSPDQFRPKLDKDQTPVFRQKIKLNNWTRPAGAPVKTTHAETEPAVATEPRTDPMRNLRDISIRFFKLNLSQKSAIAGKLGLLADEDIDVPDFERFRRVFNRACEKDLVKELEQEIVKFEETR